jgi:hypothetical protein
MSYLIYVNGLGPNYKGDNIYEFIFSNTLNVFGENWESRPCNQYPQPPEIKYIKKVGVLKNTDIELELIQNSDFFSMMDAMDDVVALAWEKDEYETKKRLVFRFGEEEQIIKDKLYERDLILEFEKNLVYEI